MSAKVTVGVRMYRLLELGDCFLLTFDHGAHRSRMLIDCGSFRNSKQSVGRLKEIAADIARQCGNAPITVAVGTHQHNDHVSGFAHCEKEFRKIGIEQVWLSWLDDPQDRIACAIGKKHNNLQLALFQARQKMRARPANAEGLRTLEIVDDMLGFYGAAGKAPPALPAKAVSIMKGLGSKKPEYLLPGTVRDMPGLPAGSVRLHVLGPPRSEKLLHRTNPRAGESYDHALASAHVAASKLLSAAGNRSGKAPVEEEQYPFGERYKRRSRNRSSTLRALIRRYNAKGEDWRRIDDDWMDEAGSLALFLDGYTNNSSLVLAVELVQSGKVLLFAADAQTGNWLSWPDIEWASPDMKTDDLLARTVLYKVGHHGSHNATLVKALEKMTHPDLVALIPVHKKDPNITKKNGWKMPARNLLKRLRERTSERVLQMDCVDPAACDITKEPARTAWEKCGMRPRQTPLYIDLEIRE